MVVVSAESNPAAVTGEAFASFQALYDFTLDPFQVEACRALEEGHGVLVAAPTGSGKTLVGEFAVHIALAENRKCFYTTPIKALSNQKYADLVKRYGPARVGLLTGDNTINGEAPVVVMTTEVLRNMLYASSTTLTGLGYVVMDEVHYLADRMRGGVWEEVIIHLPESVRLISLSATVSNAEEFADWLVTVRGETKVIVEEHRPIPLWQHMMVGPRLYDLFVGGGSKELKLNPELARVTGEEERRARATDRNHTGRGDRRPRRRDTPSRVEVIERLDADGLLPAITFIFSRAGCEGAVVQCLRAGVRLNTPSEAAEVRAIVEERTAIIPDEDLHILGYHEWIEALQRGIAAHHAGMLPTFKEVVEELFTRGLVKAVFATETLALGINMPARTVVLERLVKWNGEAHVDVTPGEYTQLTGRAGRRGIDVEGHAVVLWTQGLDPGSVAGLASTRTYPLRSSFRPSYNMAVNLVGQVGRDRARVLLESSFAQFQADRAVVGLARQIQKNDEALDGYREAMACHLGDFEEYAALRRKLSDVEAESARSASALRKAAAAASLEKLKPGDVVRIPGGRRAGLAIVLDPGLQPGTEDPRPVVLTEERQVKRLSVLDFPHPVEPVGRVRIPKSFSGRNSQDRRELAITLRNHAFDEAHTNDGPKHATSDPVADQIAQLRAQLRAHPCHGCSDREQHARWAERYWRLRRDTDALRRRVENRTNSIARVFDRVCDLLEHLDYLEGETGHRGRTPIGSPVRRARPVGGRMPARGHLARIDATRTRRLCLRAGVRSARTHDRATATAARPGSCGARRHDEALGSARKGRARSAPRIPARARTRIRLGCISLGIGRKPRFGAHRQRDDRGRFRPLDPTIARLARADRASRRRRHQTHRRTFDGRAAQGSGRLLLGGLS